MTRMELLEELLLAIKLDLALQSRLNKTHLHSARYKLTLRGKKLARRRLLNLMLELEKT